jgi:hypothetical protein
MEESMTLRIPRFRILGRAVLTGAALLALNVTSALAQFPPDGETPRHYVPISDCAAPSSRGWTTTQSYPATAPMQGMPVAADANPTTPQTPQVPPKKETITPKELTQQPTPQTDQPDLGNEQQAAGGSESVALATPNVIGDFVSFRVLRAPTGATALQNFNHALGVVTAIRSGVFKIAENENVQPQDRIFFNYNYYYNVNADGRPAGIPSADVHREVIGFEKTFLDRRASFGLRLPYLQKEGDGGVDFLDGFGDMTAVFKYAFWYDPEGGRIASGGVVVAAPTGRAIKVPGMSDIRPTVFAPWVGVLGRGDRAWVQAFSQIAAPFDARDATLWFNDIALGYTVYQRTDNDSFLTGVAPTIEVHANTPLSHRGSFSTVIGVPDWVTLIGGTHFTFNQRATLTLGIGTPVTGPRIYDLEAVCQFNWRF